MRRAVPGATVAVLFTLYVAASYGSTAWQGALSNPHFMQNGVVLVNTSGSRGGIPACGSGQPARFAFDTMTAQGKTQVAGLLTAHATAKPVVIVGTGNCSVFGDSETIDYFYIAE